EPVIDGDIPSRIESDSGELEPDPSRVGRAANRDQDIAALQRPVAVRRAEVKTDGLAGLARHTENIDAESHLDPLVFEYLQERGRDVAIFTAGEQIPRFKDRDAAPEAAIGLRQFHADVASTDYDQVAGQGIEFEHLDVGHRLCRGEAGDVRN